MASHAARGPDARARASGPCSLDAARGRRSARPSRRTRGTSRSASRLLTIGVNIGGPKRPCALIRAAAIAAMPNRAIWGANTRRKNVARACCWRPASPETRLEKMSMIQRREHGDEDGHRDQGRQRDRHQRRDRAPGLVALLRAQLLHQHGHEDRRSGCPRARARRGSPAACSRCCRRRRDGTPSRRARAPARPPAPAP